MSTLVAAEQNEINFWQNGYPLDLYICINVNIFYIYIKYTVMRIARAHTHICKTYN